MFNIHEHLNTIVPFVVVSREVIVALYITLGGTRGIFSNLGFGGWCRSDRSRHAPIHCSVEISHLPPEFRKCSPHFHHMPID